VSFDFTSNSSYVDIPLDDENVNVFGHGANTAVALVMEVLFCDIWGGLDFFLIHITYQGGLATNLYLITINGHDGGTSFDPTSG